MFRFFFVCNERMGISYMSMRMHVREFVYCGECRILGESFLIKCNKDGGTVCLDFSKIPGKIFPLASLLKLLKVPPEKSIITSDDDDDDKWCDDDDDDEWDDEWNECDDDEWCDDELSRSLSRDPSTFISLKSL